MSARKQVGPAKILLIEDNPGDVLLVREYLGLTSGQAVTLPNGSLLQLTVVEDLASGLAMLSKPGSARFNAVVLDLNLPDSSGHESFEEILAKAPQVAIVLLTGLADEALASRALQQGVQDYLVKGRINRDLLLRSLQHAIERKKADLERERLICELKEAIARVKVLSGLVPICAGCKKIRDDRGFWNQLEVYIQQHSDAQFSHGMCPECMEKYYPTLNGKGGSPARKKRARPPKKDTGCDCD